VVRPDVVAAKVGRARAWLNDAALSLLGQQEAYLADPQRRDLALSCFVNVSPAVRLRPLSAAGTCRR
jgi:hypothetical protein